MRMSGYFSNFTFVTVSLLIFATLTLLLMLCELNISRLCEGEEGDAVDEKVVSELRSELWEKERKLTDIRLEALSSAHQLEQLQETMTNMQVCVMFLFFVFTNQNKRRIPGQGQH